MYTLCVPTHSVNIYNNFADDQLSIVDIKSNSIQHTMFLEHCSNVELIERQKFNEYQTTEVKLLIYYFFVVVNSGSS